ncbi:methyl-accepting chemotaxis protein [Vibrio sp. S4M6]|uniref:methyl-accepting chemotaxis protein n=1 Tax=Vibrio sinus TaxID=2946865 RepID=UPI00202A86A6|nr:methyl-accepting chemotaxis protein [Vibrio sinus]MCL9782053.1 methyl-accepting chemotaxis protein [Vibrio sinus]
MLTKFLVPTLGLLLLLAIVLSVYLPHIEKQALIQASTNDAISTVSQFKTLRGYYTKNVISKAKAFGMKPHYEHSGKDSIPLPATLVHELSDLISSEGLSFKLFSAFPFPNRANRQLNDFQKRAWQALQADPKKPFIEIGDTPNGPMLQVALADTMQAQGCVNCHNSHPESPKTDWKLGDVRGVLEVVKPLAPIYAQANEIRWKIIMVTFIGILAVAVVLYILFKKVVLERTNKLQKSLASLAKGDGDLTAHIEEGDKDQIGEVAAQFNQFLTKFRGIVASVISSAAKVNESVNNVANDAGNISDSINSQTQKAEHINAVIHQMTDSIKDIAKDTETSSNNISETDAEIQKSSEEMLASVEDIRNLATSMQESSAIIEQLSDNSNQIGDVLDIIKNISDQTNLLALNAAIEAARAGEQGRGFAVVADEVRSLAHRTQESVVSIQDTVESLQDLAKQAVDSVTRNIETTSHAQQRVLTVSERLEHSRQLEGAIATSIASITSAITQQTNMSVQFEEELDQLQHSTRDSHQELQRLVDELESVSHLADQLTTDLRKFKV